MPITYEIDEPRAVVLTTATGILTDADILAHKSRLLHDPKFHAGMKELSDLRWIDRLDVTPEGIQAMLRHDAEHGTELHAHRMALVASEDVVYGMARMYQSQVERVVAGVGVFRDMNEAMAWLGIG